MLRMPARADIDLIHCLAWMRSMDCPPAFVAALGFVSKASRFAATSLCWPEVSQAA